MAGELLYLSSCRKKDAVLFQALWFFQRNVRMTSNESGSKKSPPLFSNQSVAVAGTVAVILLVGGTLYREVDFSEEMLESSTVDEENLSGVVATEPPEPRLLYRSPDGAYSVE
jgi:hypothetical protein